MHINKKTLLVALMLLPIVANASEIVKPVKVSPGNDITIDIKGNKHHISYKVHPKIYGKYNLCPEDTNFPEYARTLSLNSDGTGYEDLWGMKEPRRSFTWGVYMKEGSLFARELEHHNIKGFQSYIVLLNFKDDGSWVEKTIYDKNGTMVSIGPFNSIQPNRSCK